MDKDEVQAALEGVKAAVHQKFDDGDGLHRARLQQFDSTMATVAMAASHLFDEDVRHRLDPRAHQKAIGAYVRED